MTADGEAKTYDVSSDASWAGAFETTIVVARLKNPAPLIADLRAAIHARMAESEGVSRSNVGGWHSDAGMPQWGGEAARAVVQAAIDMAQQITHVDGHNWADVRWAVQMWANVSGPGAMNAMHVHPGNLWAAVFYVDLGLGGQTAEEVGGELYFEDPRFPANAMHAGGFRPLGADGKPQPLQKDIRPQAGDLVLFPSWLRHGVRPYRGKGERISIAINLDPQTSGGPR